VDAQAQPIAQGLFTNDDPPRLLGGRRADGRVVFPCGAVDTPVPLSREGTVWSHTVQRFRPKSPPYAGPDAFEPFVFAYVELPELIVAARLTGIAPEAVRIGMAVEFAPAAIDTADPRLVPAFRARA